MYVFDACAMIAFLRGEEGADVLEDMLVQSSSACQAHALNLCEVFYDFMRVSDEPTAERAIDDIKKAGVIVREDMDTEFWKQAGRYKAIHNISIADAVALSLVNRLDAELVTSDHEFDSLADTGEFTIRFFRD